MIRVFALVLALAVSSPAVAAETVVAARTIPAQSLLGPEDLALSDQVVTGGISDIAALVGLETRVALYAGRPVRQGDVGAPAVVDRNQIIVVIYQSGGLAISTEGRALARGGAGDVIRVMNLASRATVSARIGADGVAYVAP